MYVYTTFSFQNSFSWIINPEFSGGWTPFTLAWRLTGTSIGRMSHYPPTVCWNIQLHYINYILSPFMYVFISNSNTILSAISRHRKRKIYCWTVGEVAKREDLNKDQFQTSLPCSLFSNVFTSTININLNHLINLTKIK